jgi:hypothetical protein
VLPDETFPAGIGGFSCKETTSRSLRTASYPARDAIISELR